MYVIFLEGRIETKQKGGPRNKSLNSEHIECLKSWIDQDASITLEALRKKLIEVFNVSVCAKTVDNYIDRFSYSFKRITLLPAKRNDENALNARAKYAKSFLNILSKYDEANLFFVDEVGFNIALRSRHGRSLKGCRAVHTVSQLRARNISVCCAMNKYTILKYHVQTVPYNTMNFKSFVQNLISDIASLGYGPSVLIMDNVPFHKSNTIRDVVEDNGHEILFLPPYSPFCNPIENMFSKWKQSIRQAAPSNEEELFQLINNVDNLISSEDCSSYYRHMFGFISKCINREHIIDE